VQPLVSLHKERRNTERPKEEGHVKRNTEDRVQKSQFEDCLGPSEAPKARKDFP
jgi:hypothetical protein